MSGTDFESVRDELAALQEANQPDGQKAVLALLQKHGCATLGELKERSDPALYERIIDEARQLSTGKSPRLVPTFDSIIRFIAWQPTGKCSTDDKHAIYKAIAATEELEPTQVDEIIGLLKAKLHGKPSVASIRTEIDSARHRTRRVPKGVELIIFRHHETDTTHAGLYNPETDRFLPDFPLAPIKGRDSIANICAQAGKPPIGPAAIPPGTFEFLPGSARQVTKTAVGYLVNTWTVPDARGRAVASDAVPPTVHKLLMHVLGGDKAVYEHFLNWLAVAYQTNDRTGTAWVIAGHTGTGKGLLFQEIITPLFGFRYCKSLKVKDLESRFNGWLSNCLMADIVEADVTGSQAKDVEASLRHYITDSPVRVEDKFQHAREVPNFCNVIITSNKFRPLRVPEGDRRFNVSPRQETPLSKANWLGARTGDALLEMIRSELHPFAGYLGACKIDVAQARRPMDTEQREMTIENSATTAERIGRAIKIGDLDWFLEEFWTATEGVDLLQQRRNTDAMRHVLLSAAREANLAGARRVQTSNVPAHHLCTLHNFLTPENLHKDPNEIGRTFGMTATGWKYRGRAYRIIWRTKESAEELARIVRRLEHPDEKLEAEFEKPEAEEPMGSPASPTRPVREKKPRQRPQKNPVEAAPLDRPVEVPAAQVSASESTQLNCAGHGPDGSPAVEPAVAEPDSAPVIETSQPDWDDTADPQALRDALVRQFKGRLSNDSADRLIAKGYSTPAKIAAASWGNLSANPVFAREVQSVAREICAGKTP
jgi:Family of unknown function (DUF5906)